MYMYLNFVTDATEMFSGRMLSLSNMMFMFLGLKFDILVKLATETFGCINNGFIDV